MRGSRRQTELQGPIKLPGTLAGPGSPAGVRIALPVAQKWMSRSVSRGCSLSHSPRRPGQARKSSIFLGHSQPEAAITARNRLEPRSGWGPIEPLALDVVVIASPRPAGNQGPPLVVSSNALLVPLPFVYTLRRYVEITESGHVHHGLEPRHPFEVEPAEPGSWALLVNVGSAGARGATYCIFAARPLPLLSPRSVLKYPSRSSLLLAFLSFLWQPSCAHDNSSCMSRNHAPMKSIPLPT